MRITLKKILARFSGRSGRGAGGLLTAAAGGTVGVVRRGSALVLVVSAVALMALMVVGYMALGRSDIVAAQSSRSAQQVDDQVERIIDYFTMIPANDVFSVFVEGPGYRPSAGSGFIPGVIRREATDYPFTEWERRSVNPGSDRERFSVIGSLSRGWSGTEIEAFGTSDPWLASTLPVWLNPPPEDDTEPTEWVYNTRDYSHITNASPDGRFVNLGMLRSDVPGGGFGVSSLRMSGIGSGSTRTLFRLDADGRAVATLDFGSRQLADPNVPSHWDSRQTGLFRPAADHGRSFDDIQYLLYQFADADGDGMLDSRWQELVDYTDLNSPISVLPDDGEYRWFVAARYIDLSSMVNVNTAKDLREMPTRTAPIGSTPADIDLWRLLKLTGPSEAYGFDEFSGYVWMEPDSSPTGTVDNYGKYIANDPGEDTYLIGDHAYDALQETIGKIDWTEYAGTGITPPPLAPLTAAQRRESYLTTGRLPSGTAHFGQSAFRSDGPFGSDDLLELLTFFGTNNPEISSRLERAVEGRTPELERFNPLRSNRSLKAELARLGLTNPRDPGSAQIWSAVDIRRLLTTISGARPLISAPLAFDLGSPEDLARAIKNLEYWSASETVDRPTRETPLDIVTALDQKQTNLIFQTYADALLPYSRFRGIWDSSDGAAKYRPLCYGQNPYFALMTSAAMALNLQDSFDDEEDAGPTAATLIFHNDGTLEPTKYPWAQSRPLNIGADRLPATSEATGPVAINVVGTDVQPFLTQAAAFFIYTDTPLANGGDQDWRLVPDPDNPGEMMPDDGYRVTINGEIDGENPDFLAEVVAFQLHNPFDHAASLGENYIIEFGGRTYKLEEAGAASGPIRIDPDETVVLYALGQSKDEVNARFIGAGASVGAGVDIMELWVGNQLKPTLEGRLIQIEPEADPGGSIRLLAGEGGVISSDLDDSNREVRLWYKPDAGNAARVLLDRMRDPGSDPRASLDQRLIEQSSAEAIVLGLSGRIVEYSEPGEEDHPSWEFDNSGYTITFWGTFRRPTKGDQDEVPRGALPPWCLERKHGVSLNIAEDDPVSPDRLERRYFDPDVSRGTNSESFGYRTLDDWIASQASETPDPDGILVETIKAAPADKDADAGGRLADTDHIFGGVFSQYYTELHLNNNGFRRSSGTDDVLVMRPADVLLPLGICAYQDPEGDNPDTHTDEGWTTFSEAWTEAIGYDHRKWADEDVHPGLGNEYLPGGAPAYVHEPLVMLDRGNLDLYEHYFSDLGFAVPTVPFINTDGVVDSTTGAAEFNWDPADGADERDVRMGLGIPMALSVIDHFNTFPPELPGSPRRPLGGIGEMTVGTVNIQTAPLAVLRTLPLLSPTYLENKWWWPTTVASDDLDDLGLETDIAAALDAYRGLTRVPSRTVGGDSVVIGFAPEDAQVVGSPDIFFSRASLEDSDAPGFPMPTGIWALRESPGFAARSEILAVNNFKVQYSGSDPRRFDIAQLGMLRDDNTTTTLGDRGFAEGLDPTLYGPDNDLDDGIPDDFDEQLTIANGVLNTISVRSDVFACWFIVHGYRESDTVNLGPNDPLVPTIARRYLMVLDRSNVTKLGDKPRVILLQEVPL